MEVSNFTKELPSGYNSWTDFYLHLYDIGAHDKEYTYQVFKYCDNYKFVTQVKRVSIDSVVNGFIEEVRNMSYLRLTVGRFHKIHKVLKLINNQNQSHAHYKNRVRKSKDNQQVQEGV